MQIAIVTGIWLCGLAALYLLARGMLLRFRTRQRAFQFTNDLPEPAEITEVEQNALQRWLFLAGFQQPAAAGWFIAATMATAMLGASVLYLIHVSGIVAAANRAISTIPGGVGDIFRPVLYLGPWIVLAILALFPTLYVRRVRRQRVMDVEQDLPVTLELLATLAEAGLGFDAAVNRILSAQSAKRPLAAEFWVLQVELLSGRSRTDCLRRVAKRLEIAAVTIFISALVQAEQVGAGIANVLRLQADDLRQRRRERAMELSMALPVKRMIPMVICFLPGILLITLGPTFNEFFKYADTIIRMRHP